MTPRRCCTHCHTLASCLAANDSCQVGSHCSTICSRGAARQQQQPTGLEVFHLGIRSKRVNGSLDFLARNSCTNSGCPIGVPRTFTPCCSERNSGSPLQTVASSMTCLADAVSSATPRWNNATSIPDLGFPKVQLNVRVSEQFFLQDGMHICLECCALPQCKKQRYEGSPCSLPPLCNVLCGAQFVFPQLSTWLPQKHRTKGRIWSPSSIILGPHVVEFREIRSAPTPPMDTTVALGSGSVIVCNTCATHSHPVFALKACWKNDVACSTFLAICFAMERATSLRTVSPSTVPLAPPSGLRNAVRRPNLSPARTSVGMFPVALAEQIRATV